MTTTTGDPSSLKSPASLSSGDLVSRLLAATPPYLYNVPLTPHSFFFSEMLRSFVQAKTEPSNVANVPNGSSARRRKRSWKDAATPLELTTDKRSRHHHHPHHHSQHHQHPTEKYFRSLSNSSAVGQQHATENHAESRNKSQENYEHETKSAKFEQNLHINNTIENTKIDDSCTEYKQTQNYFADRIPPADQTDVSLELQKVKPEESDRSNLYNEKSGESSYGGKNKLDFSARNFLPNLPATGRNETDLQAVKNYSLPGPGNVQNSPDFLAGPLWYPPYPMPQSYSGIDPLHFFIDLRVSGHIWDQKLGAERQLPFKGKHSSAFSVPQSKECNRPLNLTRNEASTSKSDVNPRGTHYILKHIRRTYKDIHDVEKSTTVQTSESIEEGAKACDDEICSKKDETSSLSNQEEDRKDIRAIIGLELVVDYVKEPKCDPTQEQSSTVAE